MEKPRIIFYDFEVFQFDWLGVFIENETRQEVVVYNNLDLLHQLYETNQDAIWIGYNSKNYDEYIFRGLLLHLNPYIISQALIKEKKRGYELMSNYDYPLIGFDALMDGKSLKQLEGLFGDAIIECPVSFELNRPLTQEEVQCVTTYCRWDVLGTIKTFETSIKQEEFEAKYNLVMDYQLPLTCLNDTASRLAILILGAKKRTFSDAGNITYVSTLRLERHRDVLDWYQSLDYAELERQRLMARAEKKKKGKSGKSSFKSPSYHTTVGGLQIKFGLGGCHASKQRYCEEGMFILSDVASMYPSLMVNYGFLPRTIRNPQTYVDLRNKRLQYKLQRNPLHKSYKLALSSVYGSAKSENAFYDPLQANNITINGQLLTLDLLEKIEALETVELLFANTDGIMVRIHHLEDYDRYMAVCNEWITRTGLELEHDYYRRVLIKDVSSLICFPLNPDEKIKCTGDFKIAPFNSDIPIVRRALMDYLEHGTPIESTINQCQTYREFQYIAKLASDKTHFLYRGKSLPHKVVRVFASKQPSDTGLTALTKDGRPAKVPSTPSCCYLDNRNVNELAIPEQLNRDYYIQLTHQRLAKLFSLS